MADSLLLSSFLSFKKRNYAYIFKTWLEYYLSWLDPQHCEILQYLLCYLYFLSWTVLREVSSPLHHYNKNWVHIINIIWTAVTHETYSRITCTYACFLMFVITDMGSLNRTEVPRNLRCPTAVRKSANGKASLAPVPNTLQSTKMFFIFIGSLISFSISLIQF